MFSNYNSLAFNNPYYTFDSKIKIFDSFDNCINSFPEVSLDPVAIIEFLSKGYCFGDRTMIKNVSRTPWMAQPSTNFREWQYYDVPSHGRSNQGEINIADRLYVLLEKEIASFCKEKGEIGILLSGGMDSRVTAGILNNLKKKGRVSAKITAITWGSENSRDVVYAKKIADIFEWRWEHLTLDASNLMENINVVSELGCEVSPIHLHAMPRVKQFTELDCIIASSFGDSMGRGVYSGRHITNLTNNRNYIKNNFFLLRSGIYRENKNFAFTDLDDYRVKFGRENERSYLELEQQAHYMRRMLNPCLGIINKDIPVYQTFSSPAVYGYMWSINPEKRSNRIYSIILNKYISELHEIPWSKTGIKYEDTGGISDNYNRDYHSYHTWINNDLFDYLMDELGSKYLDIWSIFNRKSFNRVVQANRQLSLNRLTRMDDILVWAVSLMNMVKRYDVHIDTPVKGIVPFDGINTVLAKPYLHIYEGGLDLKRRLRK